jgi:hypothetical protein
VTGDGVDVEVVVVVMGGVVGVAVLLWQVVGVVRGAAEQREGSDLLPELLQKE